MVVIAHDGIDARFEVLGSPFSLLSASISPSQNLYTRKGTLVGFNGKAENVPHHPKPNNPNSTDLQQARPSPPSPSSPPSNAP